MSDFEIRADNHSAEVTATGDDTDETKQQMGTLLNAIDPLLDGEITELNIEVKTDEVVPAPDPDPSATGPMGEVERGDREIKSWEAIDEDRRKKGPFASGSSYHVIASHLYERDEALTSREIRDNLDKIKEGTVSGGISKLYERRVIDKRERGEHPEQGGRVITEYYLTDHGEELVEEKGTYTQEEWINDD